MGRISKIRQIYNAHKEKFQYDIPATESIDLYILEKCMTQKYKNNWIKAMQKYPPKCYPLDMAYSPSHNIWFDLYLNSYEGRASLGIMIFNVKNENAFKEIYRLNGLEING